MTFNLSSTGKLSYSQAFLPQNFNNISFPTNNHEVHDPVGTHSVYVNSINHVENGHLVTFSETQAPTSIADIHTVRESTDGDHTFGVVMELAATANDTSFTNKNGQHNIHNIRDHSNILRVARQGSIVYAWVVDDHENEFEGIYEKTINGTSSGLVAINDVGSEFFVIRSLNSVEQDVQDIKARLDALIH